jgi:hypothetical protein
MPAIWPWWLPGRFFIGSTARIPSARMVFAHHRQLDCERGSLAGCSTYWAKTFTQAERLAVTLHFGIKPVPTTA